MRGDRALGNRAEQLLGKMQTDDPRPELPVMLQESLNLKEFPWLQRVSILSSCGNAWGRRR